MSTDREWQILIDEWKSQPPSTTPHDEIRRYVQRRSRLLTTWFVAEILLGAGFLVFLVYRSVTTADPFESLVMGLLGLITIGAVTFGWWNWRGHLRAAGETTATYLAMSRERSRRLARSIRAGWVVLALQIAVFVPWTWHRLYGLGGQPSPERETFVWGFLIAMVASAVVFLVGVRRWIARDARALDVLSRELEAEVAEGRDSQN